MACALYPLSLSALLLCLAAPAQAGHFTVSPVKVRLDATARTDLLTVTNRSPRTIQLQVQPMVWGQTPDGRDTLAPTTQLLAFPTLFELAPGAYRIVRVGTLSAPVDQEQTYRLLITELPSDEALESRNGIAMRLRLSVPVFSTPKGARPAPAVAQPQVAGSQVRATLSNAGSAHTQALKVTLTAEDPAGAVVFERALSAWYLLAASERAYSVDLPREACRSTARLVLRVETAHQVLRTASPGPFDCGAP